MTSIPPGKEQSLAIPAPAVGPQRTLSLFDAICIIVGTIIGAGIFQTAPIIARSAGNFSSLILLWMLGGLLTIIGALCFTELTTRFKDVPGGDYGFLKLAYGRGWAFMFAWATFWIIRPGNMGAMALTFALYFDQVRPASTHPNHGSNYQVWYAIAIVLILSATNLIGLKQGKWVQNTLTLVKVIGILAIVGLGLFSGNALSPEAVDSPATGNLITAASWSSWLLALVFIMFSFGGWNDLSFVATEIRDPDKNLFRSLVLGALIVTGIYLLLNIAFASSLGYEAMTKSQAVATDVIRNSFGQESLVGQRGAQIVAALICISCMGAINGIIITSPRIYYAAGRDFRGIASLGRWNARRDQPWLATAIQALVTIGLFLFCFRYENPFEVIVVASAPFFWAFLGLVGVSLIVLRQKIPPSRTVGSFQVPFYPISPVILSAACFAMAYSSTRHLIDQQLWLAGGMVAVLMAIGIVLGFVLKPTIEEEDADRPNETERSS